MYHTMIDPRIYTDVDGRYVGGDYKYIRLTALLQTYYIQWMGCIS